MVYGTVWFWETEDTTHGNDIGAHLKDSGVPSQCLTWGLHLSGLK